MHYSSDGFGFIVNTIWHDTWHEMKKTKIKLNGSSTLVTICQIYDINNSSSKTLIFKVWYPPKTVQEFS